eukprot:3740813-Amphidinium_carterae.1
MHICRSQGEGGHGTEAPGEGVRASPGEKQEQRSLQHSSWHLCAIAERSALRLNPWDCRLH